MKKREQIDVNVYVENIVDDINAIMRTTKIPLRWKRLHRCTADWCIIGDWAILRSYSTIVAAYNVENGVLFDFLRLVYGYTATSAQHIAKFRNFVREKYWYQCGGLWTVTWREV